MAAYTAYGDYVEWHNYQGREMPAWPEPRRDDPGGLDGGGLTGGRPCDAERGSSVENFLLITTGLDTLPLLHSISCQPWLWDEDTVRTTHPGSVHKDVSDILAFFQPSGAFDAMRDGHECLPRKAWWALPELRPLVFGLMGRIQGTRLGRVIITRLPAGGIIPPHIDAASQTSYYRRMQITLCSPPECLFVVGDEQLSLTPGSCWWIDNSKEHAVYNEGITDRQAVIVDIHVPTLNEDAYGSGNPGPS